MDAPQWEEVELSFELAGTYANPYLGLSACVKFTHESGSVISRPAFWDGGRTVRVRFASTTDSGVWTWKAYCSPEDAGVSGKAGELRAVPAKGANGVFSRRGFWRMDGRNLRHADGTSALLVGDTAWAIPWRATPDEVETWAADRGGKGFNAALLMAVQPDMRATGPRDRTAPGGFDVGFDDLPEGTLRVLRPEYWQYVDRLVAVMRRRGIVPVWQPVFHGYGWKGLGVVGLVASCADVERFQRYLIARYGAGPAVWLVSGDGPGTVPNVEAAGLMCQREDDYAHPTGIHYAPHVPAPVHQDKPWLDFQWCQTGHNGEHIPERAAQLFHAEPPKGAANGEPTYEHIGAIGKAEGWWQGHEAWLNLTAGGMMGVVYGAGSLWQWKRDGEEANHETWACAPGRTWRQAVDFPGSAFVGAVGRVFAGLDLTDVRPNWWFVYGGRGLEGGKPGRRWYLLYRETGLGFAAPSPEIPSDYTVFDATSGEVITKGRLADQGLRHVPLDGKGPRVVLFGA